MLCKIWSAYREHMRVVRAMSVIFPTHAVHRCVMAVRPDNTAEEWFEHHGNHCRKCSEIVNDQHLCAGTN